MKTLRQASCQCGICNDRKHFPRLLTPSPQRIKPDLMDRVMTVIVVLAGLYLFLVAAWTWPLLGMALGTILVLAIFIEWAR